MGHTLFGHAPEVGEKAPLWSAESNNGAVEIADYLGRGAVLLLFYPADWSEVCREELPLLEELVTLAGKVKLKTFGISHDGLNSHKAFAREIGLRLISLVSDPYREISRAYGVSEANDTTCKRAAFLIDTEGVVRWTRLAVDVSEPYSIQEIEKALEMVREWDGLSNNLENWKRERQQAVQLPRVAPLAPPTHLQLSFWGTRGSIPVSGLNYNRYGGNTSCVSLTSDSGHLFIFDCGSGARELGNFLMSSQWSPPTNAEPATKKVEGYIFLSHTHWDHIQGFPFFSPVFRSPNRFNIIGWSNCSQTLGSILAGQMEYNYFPVSMNDLPSKLSFYSIQHGEVYLDGARVVGRLLKHPTPSTAYRLELAGRTLVYATDHEPHLPPPLITNTLLGDDVINAHLVEMASGADLLIHDAQYSGIELAEKVGWGHSSVEVAVDTAIRAGVKRLVLYHHDPSHNDDDIDALLATALHRASVLKNDTLQILAAYDGLKLEL